MAAAATDPRADAAPEVGASAAADDSSEAVAPATEVPAEELPLELIYACRKCKKALFKPSHVDEEAARTEAAAGTVAGSGVFFLKEAMKWMGPATSEVESKIYCPGCETRVGSINWVGVQLPHAWVSPAIQISKKAVDPRYVRIRPAPPRPPTPPPAPEPAPEKKSRKSKKPKEDGSTSAASSGASSSAGGGGGGGGASGSGSGSGKKSRGTVG